MPEAADNCKKMATEILFENRARLPIGETFYDAKLGK
jgi:hypothetical protein